MLITIEEAIHFVQWLEPQLAEKHFHCALTGSTLYKGFSNKDIDIIIYAHNESNGLLPMDAFYALKEIFPSTYRLDNPEYPQDRLVLRNTADYGWKMDFFVQIDVGFDSRKDPRWNPDGR